MWDVGTEGFILSCYANQGPHNMHIFILIKCDVKFFYLEEYSIIIN